jgi:hypothetical protein
MGRMHAGLLGRNAELALLRSVADRAAAGAPTRVLVVAPPGVGKTRLVEEFASSLDAGSGWQVVQVRVAAGASAPFEPIARLLSGALDGGTGRPPGTGRMGGDELLPRLEQALASADITPGRAATVREDVRRLFDITSAPLASADRAILFASWLEALDAAAVGRHPAWIFEDLHWASRDLLDFLGAAQVAAPRTGRLVVATSRPGILDDAAVESWEQIDLKTLASTDARSLVQELVGSALPSALADRIAARSDGNCLFIEELLRAWVGTGVLVEDRDGRLVLAVDPEDVQLPPTVQAIYAAQLDDLPGPARMAARRGSVAGRRFAGGSLPALGIEDATAAVATLGRRGIVAGPFPAGSVGDEYAFRHALLRDAGYASLGRAERAELHVRLARWLEKIADGRGNELAATIGRHYADALDATPVLATQVAEGLDRPTAGALAAHWLERAGAIALEAGANATAVELLRRAIDLTAGHVRLDLARRWRQLGDSIVGVLDLGDAAAAFATAADHAAAALEDAGATADDLRPARRELALSSAGLSTARYEQLQFEEALSIADAALAMVGEDGPDAVRLRLARLHALEGVGNEYAAVEREAEIVLEAARATGDELLILEARRARLGFEVDPGRSTADAWLALAADARTLGRWSHAVSSLTIASSIVGETDPVAAGSLLREAAVLAEARGLNAQRSWIAYAQTVAALVDGDWDPGTAAALEGIGIAERHGYDRAAVRTWFALTPMAEARLDRELLEHARAWFEPRWASFPTSPYGLVMGTAVEVRLATAGLRPSPALEGPALIDAVGLDDGSADWLSAIETLVDGALAAGAVELAGAIIARLPAAGAGGNETLVRSSRSLVRARVEAARATLAKTDPVASVAAVASAREALELARAARAPWWQARAARLLAELGAALPAELEEAATIERQLGIPQLG